MQHDCLACLYHAKMSAALKWTMKLSCDTFLSSPYMDDCAAEVSHKDKIQSQAIRNQNKIIMLELAADDASEYLNLWDCSLQGENTGENYCSVHEVVNNHFMINIK